MNKVLDPHGKRSRRGLQAPPHAGFSDGAAFSPCPNPTEGRKVFAVIASRLDSIHGSFGTWSPGGCLNGESPGVGDDP